MATQVCVNGTLHGVRDESKAKHGVVDGRAYLLGRVHIVNSKPSIDNLFLIVMC